MGRNILPADVRAAHAGLGGEGSEMSLDLGGAERALDRDGEGAGAVARVLARVLRRAFSAVAVRGAAGQDDGEGDELSSSSTPSWSSHPDDPGLWLYHVETTTSTMDT